MASPAVASHARQGNRPPPRKGRSDRRRVKSIGWRSLHRRGPPGYLWPPRRIGESRTQPPPHTARSPPIAGARMGTRWERTAPNAVGQVWMRRHADQTKRHAMSLLRTGLTGLGRLENRCQPAPTPADGRGRSSEIAGGTGSRGALACVGRPKVHDARMHVDGPPTRAGRGK